MTTYNYRSNSLQDTDKAIHKITFHESDSHLDLAESPLSSPDSPLQDIMNEIEEEILEDIEEEIEEELEGETADELEEEIKEDIEEEIKEDLEGETLQEFDYLSDFKESPLISPDSDIPDFNQFIESELSRKSGLQKDLLKEGGARTAIEVNVNRVKRDRSQLEDYLERKEKEALPKTLSLNQEQAPTSGREATIVHMKKEGADSSSGEDQQHREDLKLASEEKTPRSRLEDALHEKAHQEDREACSRLEEQVKKEEVWFLPVNNKLERLKKAPADRGELMYDKETVSLQNNDITGKLEAMEAKWKETVSKKDNIIFENQAIIVELRHSVDKLTARLANSEGKNAQIEDALIQQQKDADKLDNLTNENQQLASENKRLQGELEDALREMQLAGDATLSEQLVERDKLDSLTRENQQVASVNNKLRIALFNAVRERHVADISKQRKLDNLTEENHHLASKSKSVKGELEDAVQQHQEDREACRRLEEEVKKEKTRFLQLNKKLVRLKRGSADRELLMNEIETLSLQNNDITGKFRAMEAKIKETMSQKDDIIFKNQASIIENQQLAFENKRLKGELEEQAKKEKARFLQLNKKLARLKRGPADTEKLMYDKETCRMENKYITGKLEAMDAKYDLLVQRDRAHSRGNEELLAQKDDVLLKNQAIKLQYIVDELRTQQSESMLKQAQLKETLRQEQIQRAVLEERISNTASLEQQKMKTVHLAYALKTERAKSKKYSFELTEAKISQVKLQERQHLSPSLHNL